MSPRSSQYVAVSPAVPVPAGKRQEFTYRLAGNTAAQVGSAALIPFGRRRVLGIITGFLKTTAAMELKVAYPLSGLSLTPKQMKFADWMAKTMHGSFGYTLRLFLPPRVARPPAPAVFPAQKPKRARTTDISVLAHPVIVALDGNAPRRRTQLKELIQKVASQPGQVLVLVPEKSFLREWQEFPQLHAALPAKELSSLWHGAAAGSLQVIVGTQKALFLPFKNLRLIVVDEEQFPTHKLWDQYPRLDNRDGAAMLAKQHQAALLLSASFPSLSLYQRLQNDIPTLSAHLPTLRVSAFPFTGGDRGQRNVLPLDFVETLKSWVKKKHHTMLLLNRT
ncbi:MAG: hypothetical protein AAB538_04645, partial [Patescibacteria group bacterium]